MIRTARPEIICEDFVIQGILKEILIAECSFELSGSKVKFKLLDILESKIRGNSELKRLIFSKKMDSDYYEPFKKNVSYIFSAGFYRSQVSIEIKFIEQGSPDQLFFELPTSLKTTNYRIQERSLVSKERQKPCPLLIHTNGLHCEGTFTIEDTSFEGFGGLLQVPKLFPLNISSTVTGELIIENGELSVNGKIARAIQLPNTSEEYDNYRVGVLQIQKEQNANSDQEERRRDKRHPIQHKINLTPLLHPEFKFDLLLEDISINGFSGKTPAGSTVPCIPIGAMFLLAETRTKVRLVRFSDELLRFDIVSRTEKDCVAWLRTMTPLLYKGAKCSVRDARDLYKIFLQAGAISSQYLKRHSLYKGSLIADQKNFENESGYLHRWYVGNSEGAIEAHISAVRVSDSCWFLGDFAKVTKSEIKGEALVRYFFYSFSDFCNSLSPSPCLMGMWLHSHPLWQKWNTYLKTNNADQILSSVLLQYHRITVSDSVSIVNTTVLTEEIKSQNYGKLLDISEKLKLEGTDHFAKFGFDFDYISFSSPRLKSEIKQHFSRNYFLLRAGDTECLAITTKLPPSTSFNRIADSIYIFPLNHLKTNETELFSIRKKSYELSILLGLDSPATRTVFPDKPRYFSLDGIMQCYILTPLGFKSFEGFR